MHLVAGRLLVGDLHLIARIPGPFPERGADEHSAISLRRHPPFHDQFEVGEFTAHVEHELPVTATLAADNAVLDLKIILVLPDLPACQIPAVEQREVAVAVRHECRNIRFRMRCGHQQKE